MGGLDGGLCNDSLEWFCLFRRRLLDNLLSPRLRRREDLTDSVSLSVDWGGFSIFLHVSVKETCGCDRHAYSSLESHSDYYLDDPRRLEEERLCERSVTIVGVELSSKRCRHWLSNHCPRGFRRSPLLVQRISYSTEPIWRFAWLCIPDAWDETTEFRQRCFTAAGSDDLCQGMFYNIEHRIL